MLDDIQAIGVRASSGRRYVMLSQRDNEGLIPAEAFVLTNKVMVNVLTQHGILVIDKKQLEVLVSRVQDLDYFPAMAIAEKVGWNDDLFALQDGTVISAEKHGDACAAFPRDTSKCSSAGTLTHWKKRVAGPLIDQPLPAFVLMLAFLPPLLHLMPMVPNCSIALIGRGGTGKSTLAKIAASALGDIGIGGGNRYWHGLEEVAERMGELLEHHRDHLMVLDNGEALFTKAHEKAAAKVYKALAHDLTGAQTRAVAFATTRGSLRDVKGGGVEGSDPMITLSVPNGAPHGVFETVPKDFGNAAAFAEALIREAAANHGHAIRHFVARVAISKSKDPTRLHQRLDDWQREFLEQAGVDGNDGMNQRVARVFAAVYAAGCQARLHGSLPKSLNCLDAALRCYRAHYIPDEAEQPFATRLKTLIRRSDILTITNGAEELIQADAARNALGTIVHLSTHRELRIAPANIYKAFSDWDRLKGRDDVRDYLKAEGKNLRVKAKLAPGLEKVRMFCFRLEFAEESIFDNAETVEEDGS